MLAATGTWNPWKTLSVATVVSAISGAAINETVGSDINGDGDNNDRPIRGINDLLIPIRSELDGAGRAVINGLTGPESFLIDMSFRYSIPLKAGFDSLDLFYDIFNVVQPREPRRPVGQPLVVGVHDSDRGAVRAADAVRYPRAVLTVAHPCTGGPVGRPFRAASGVNGAVV